MISDFYHYDFLQYALIGTFFLSLSSGILSPLVVARQHAFMGSALSHSTLLGVAVALAIIELLPTTSIITNNLLIFWITFVITIGSVFILAQATFRNQTPSDSSIGIYLAVSMGLSVIVHQLFVTTGADLMSYLFGQIILLTIEDIWLVAIVSLIISLTILMRIGQWRTLTFDEDGALLMGLNAKLYHYIFYTLLTLFVVSGVKISGTILVNSLLLAPGIFAFKRAHSLTQSFVYGVSFSLVTSVLGLVLSNWLNLPPGATMASVQCSFLALDSLVRKLKFI